MHIALEGCIGAGKSTTAAILAKRLGMPFIAEASDRHPFLEKFYSDVLKYAFETELGFLLIHYHQLFHCTFPSFITDFSFEKDLVFARLNLEGGELKLFETVYDDLRRRLTPPAITVLLKVSVPTLSERIRGRGRPYEKEMSAEYLERLGSAYGQNASTLWPSVREVVVGPEQTPESVADAVQACIGSIEGVSAL